MSRRWYLIAPPVRTPDNEPAYLDVHAEYRDWTVLDPVKTEDQCDFAYRAGRANAKEHRLLFFPYSGGVKGGDINPWLEQQSETECVESDGPVMRTCTARSMFAIG